MHTLSYIDHSHLEKVIQSVIANKMVPVVELHDATCKQDPNELIKSANWFAQNIWLFNKYKKYIIINIANEWVFFLNSNSFSKYYRFEFLEPS